MIVELVNLRGMLDGQIEGIMAVLAVGLEADRKAGIR